MLETDKHQKVLKIKWDSEKHNNEIKHLDYKESIPYLIKQEEQMLMMFKSKKMQDNTNEHDKVIEAIEDYIKILKDDYNN